MKQMIYIYVFCNIRPQKKLKKKRRKKKVERPKWKPPGSIPTPFQKEEKEKMGIIRSSMMGRGPIDPSYHILRSSA